MENESVTELPDAPVSKNRFLESVRTILSTRATNHEVVVLHDYQHHAIQLHVHSYEQFS